MGYAKDSYKTTIGSHLITKDIELAIKEAMIKDNIQENNLNVHSNGAYNAVFITGKYSSENDIPIFIHPITIDNFKGANYLCTDLRLFINSKNESDNIEDAIKNKTEYNFIKSRAILNLLWANGNTTLIKNSTALASTLFSIWLSNIISKNYALDMKDQLTLNVITSYYYQTLFMTDYDFSEEQKQKMAVHTINATAEKAEFVLEIFDRITKMENINDYISNVINILENVRLNNFNLAVLLTIIKNSWYGNNAKEIISVALEHPPTWIAIVYTALTERTYKNSMIYKISENFGKRGKSDEFIKNYTQLMQDQISKEDIKVEYDSNAELSKLENYE